MIYEEYAAPSRLSAYVERLWAFRLDDGDPQVLEHVIVPEGTASLNVITYPGGCAVSLTGPTMVAQRVRAERGTIYHGVRIRPGCFRALTGGDIAGTVGRILPLAEVAPSLAASLAGCGGASSLEAFFARLDAAMPGPFGAADPIVTALAQAIMDSDGSVPLAPLMAGFGLSPRQLRRRFAAETGLTPKAFSRLRRVRRACADLARRDDGMAVVSADHGFADQPHFTREMKSVFALSPQMLHAYLRQIRHHNMAEDVRNLQGTAPGA